MPRHLTLAEVCDELGVARSTFNDWRAKGRAPKWQIRLPWQDQPVMFGSCPARSPCVDRALARP
jgi:hypothetical protein